MKIISKKLLHLILVLTLFPTLVFAQHTNIVLLFADDAGYHDFGFQGSNTFPTPNLDVLAREGVVFEQAYTTAAVCGPSRAGMLTGMYQQRFGFEENNVPGYMSQSSKLMGDEMGLPLHLQTIADHLNPLGYRSLLLGKWHMGNADKYHPLKRGFDEFYGFRGGARSFWALSDEEAKKRPEDRWEHGFGNHEEPEEYLTDAIAREACDFIARNQQNPFFMYVSFNAVHSPLHAKDEDLEQIKGLTGKRKTLAAMTLAMDRACGQILTKLKELGLEENTLVVFTNDNGGPVGTMTSNYPLSGAKSNNLEGGIRVPFVMKWPGVAPANSTFSFPISTLDLLPTFVNAAGGNAKQINGLDGVDLLPYLTNTATGRPHKTLYWKKENRGIIRHEDWKLIRYPDRPAELYYLPDDAAEENNLAYEYPDKVRELFKQLWSWESQLERPLFMLRREYEVKALQRMDEHREPLVDE
ncbi:sulfatase-like hydrolase/transferase [Marinoscillum furvescens]|uniref:Arylsulfatase A-like enzyme n=1 Tax=Marinoscillum furvescens DSM 4134 TaxID=1122208 RepID=A0A3D9KZK3_MARFU|nr:sulfatase-like hydrolase/transferase [Marinoscillum furvescens]RED95998.1 arylsulfatase A-like enzyme [Marinoscillum furvescens DSM 4134]